MPRLLLRLPSTSQTLGILHSIAYSDCCIQWVASLKLGEKHISMISFAINESIWSRQHFSEGIIWSKSVDKPPGTIAKLPLPHTKTLATLGEYYHQNYTCAYISHHVLHTYHVLVREKLQLPDPDWSTEPDDYLLGIKTVPGYSMCVCECMCVHVWLHGHD